MKNSYLFKTLVSGLILASGSIANAQCIHPLAFPANATSSNWYLQYVGERFEVTYPSSIAGDKVFTTPNDGSGATGAWGGFPGTSPALPIIAPYDTVMNYPTDSTLSTGVVPPAGTFTNRIALIYRGSSQFGVKAHYAELGGATACVIVNNVPGGPVGMAAGTDGASVTIPVFMVSKADGDAMNQQLHEGIPVTLAVFNWGQGLVNDLGFVPGGLAQWHNGAIPAYEFLAGGSPDAYTAMDGAYIANYGSATVNNVVLQATTSFTPTGGGATVVNTNSVTLTSFPQTDSIWAMFCPQYNLSTLITGPGTINVTYNISATGFVDQFPFDNTASYNVDVTGNVYCKGRWDGANHRPFVSSYNGSGADATGTFSPYVFGPSFYVNKGWYADSATFAVVSGSSSGVTYVIPTATVNVYLFKWVDGSGSSAADSFMQNDEMQLCGVGTKTFNGTTDSSFQFYSVQFTLDTVGFTLGTPCSLSNNSWYWVAAEMPQSGTQDYLIGVDGVNNGFPRLLGRADLNNYIEYYAPLWASGDRNTSTNSMAAYSNYFDELVPFGGTYSILSIDSTVFSNEKGLIPNISLTTSQFPVKIKEAQTKVNEFNLYPNPASTSINLSVGFETTVNKVTYKVMSTGGRIISSETHNNVLNETFSYNTEKLANGIYYVVVNAGDRTMFKKFTVLR